MKSRCYYLRAASLWIVVLVAVSSSSRIGRRHEASAWMLARRPIRNHNNGIPRSQMSEDRQLLSTASRRPSVLSSRLVKSLQRSNLISRRSSQVVENDMESSRTTTNVPLFLTNDFTSSQTSPLNMDLEEINDDVVDIFEGGSQNLDQDNEKLRQLYQSLHTSATKSTDEKCPILFDTSGEDVVRGIYITKPFKKDEPILLIPLDPTTTTTEDSSWFGCLVDNRPPSWLPEHVQDAPDKWATRLAASWLDLYLQHQQKDDSTSGSFELWLDLLPEPEELRSSLPVHWSEDTLRKAKCTTLELAVDSAFFVRGEAMADLVEGLQLSPYKIPKGSQKIPQNSSWEKLCEYALDLVQTRACRLELKPTESHSIKDGQTEQYAESNQIRVMAPIFDFINHGGPGSANAYFELEELQGPEQNDVHDHVETLVVKASRDMENGEQLLIDYGAASTWPSWKCLFSYGFVPQYDPSSESDEAEVYVAGVRYEVSRDTIPVEMVMAACPMPESEEGGVELSPDLANKLANRITVAAYNLLLEADDDFDEDVDDEDLSLIWSEQLAANLRWSQHRVLLACADGLIKYVEEMQNDGQ